MSRPDPYLSVSIGLNWLTEELDLNPLLANMGFSVIAQLLQATITPSSDPNDDRNVFEKMFDAFKGNVATFLGHNPTPNKWDERFWKPNADGTAYVFQENLYNQAWGNYYWEESAHMSQILNLNGVFI